MTLAKAIISDFATIDDQRMGASPQGQSKFLFSEHIAGSSGICVNAIARSCVRQGEFLDKAA